MPLSPYWDTAYNAGKQSGEEDARNGRPENCQTPGCVSSGLDERYREGYLTGYRRVRADTNFTTNSTMTEGEN